MSKILEHVHRSAKRLHEAGHLDNSTMKEFNALCSPPVRGKAANGAKRIRRGAKAGRSPSHREGKQ